ncbi:MULTISPECIES: pyridoxamine 5'-phosphate oxidase family protein [Legionella]|uniref:Pyridoxamine 5'-phosphate oxidase n=1 Tax=Legionella drozanskii LLAP-1 TaxID=1212489 RepID=A0A0W0TDU0_9GAMM|nr:MULTISPECIES: pyridoxamine 5'-phosphate oxidase family protein [Legionella]KTC93768.1 Pyridoxamine 5'-phosphate oxidase [Legionella drozanskii LLAP-1]PJE13573.1 MAG: hypothetical protein CK430_06115 [Legionella sp.]
MNSHELSNLLKNRLNDWFNFSRNPIYGQVTTVYNELPYVRTMHLYELTPRGSLIFLTSTHSGKWQHLIKNAHVAICLMNADYGQILVEGSALLHTRQTNLALTSLYWENYLEESWQNFYISEDSDVLKETIPSSFGIVEVVPKTWEILEINKIDFTKGKRKKYILQEGMWNVNQLPII